MSLEKDLQIRDKIIDTFNKYPGYEIYANVLDIIMNTIKSSYGIFGYIATNGDLICPSMTRDVMEECRIEGKDIIFPRKDWENSRALWARAIIEGTTKYSNEPFKVPEGHIPMNRAIMVPIKSQNKVIGILEVANKESDYNIQEVELLETIASYISPILKLRLESKRDKKERIEIEKKLKDSKKVTKKSNNIIDEVDKQILNQLFIDGTQTRIGMEIKIKKKIMSHTGVKNRINKLINKGLLKIQANIDPNRLNLKFAQIKIEFNNYNDINNYLNKYYDCPRIYMISKITGQFHLFIGVIGKTLDDLNNFLNYCVLSERELIKSFEITFSSEISKPQFLPINFFSVDNQNTICGRNCLECQAYKNDWCFGCNPI